MSRFEHERHKPATRPATDPELVVVCPPLKSRVNLSRIVRVAGCSGIRRLVACRPFSIDPAIARSASEFVHVESRGSMLPVLDRLRAEGYSLVGLEQTTQSKCLYDFRFPQRTALILGHERTGIEAACLAKLDFVAEIPVYGEPLSYNVATAATMAIYEYCRQHVRS